MRSPRTTAIPPTGLDRAVLGAPPMVREDKSAEQPAAERDACAQAESHQELAVDFNRAHACIVTEHPLKLQALVVLGQSTPLARF